MSDIALMIAIMGAGLLLGGLIALIKDAIES